MGFVGKFSSLHTRSNSHDIACPDISAGRPEGTRIALVLLACGEAFLFGVLMTVHVFTLRQTGSYWIDFGRIQRLDVAWPECSGTGSWEMVGRFSPVEFSAMRRLSEGAAETV